MPVALVAAAVTAGATVYASNQSSKAVKTASNASKDATAQQIAFQQQARDEARQQLTPYSQEGAQARRMYDAAMGISPATGTSTAAGVAGADTLGAAQSAYNSGFDNSPYWRDAQYATTQALNALRSTNAAMGRGSSINSGKALRAASDITQGYRGTATQNYLNSLAGVAGTGFQADSGIASGGQVFANNASSAVAQNAALQGQYALAGATNAGNLASNVSGLAGYLAGNYQPGGQSYFAPVQSLSVQPLPNTSLGTLSDVPNFYTPTIYPGG